ncbi:putative oxidoreductase [Xylariales sp. PMI_506]|nr:putative oxidoreductase [Xylariales sp. PMI_506]
MAALVSMVTRAITALSPPAVEKKNGAIKFGILGAAKTTPVSLLIPATSHPEVIVQAVSARDRTRAQEFAKKHGIPDVRDTYQDAIFIPLPNSLHFEWAVRSIRAGKHVLLEKPSTSNSTEADLLFNMPELSLPNAPILLEAFHNRFHPALQFFLTLFNPADVAHVYTESMIPWWMTAKGNIEFNYSLAGGSMMMVGTYNFGIMRMIFGAEPEECLACETSIFDDGLHDQADYAYKAKFRFPNGGVGEATTTMRGPTIWKPSEARVTTREIVVSDKALPATEEKVMTRQVTIRGFMNAVIWHRIDVRDLYVIRNKADGQPVRKWTESKSHKAYTWKEAGGKFAELPADDWWLSHRHMLEQFVNRIKGRPTTYWITGEDSIKQMKMIDMAYEKSGLGLRPTSSFR